MKGIVLSAFALGAVISLAEQGNPFPDKWHAWRTNDSFAPNPKVVKASPGSVPSDARVLFDGTEESLRANWCANRWVVNDGAMHPVPKAGDLVSKREFADCQIHVEWCAPDLPEDVKSQARGNSGVFLMGNYEIQVLDSSACDPDKNPNPNKTYADGQAGAVYGDSAPLVNAVGPGGTWQAYDIVFHPPTFADGKLEHPGSVTVFLNGILVQDHFELGERLRYQKLPPKSRGPLRFQDHQNPTRFRNVWVREIPSRYADKVNGGPGATPEAVAAKQAEIAAGFKAKADAAPNASGRLHELLQAYSYSRDPKILEEAREVIKRCSASDVGLANRIRILRRHDVLPKDFPELP